jgi:type IV pilus assembly protein PilW
MNPHRIDRPAHATRQRGLGLVEVLVAMTVGLVLLGGVGYLFMGSKQLNSTQSDSVRMQESARNAMDMMGRALRQSGYKLNINLDGLDQPALGGVSGAGAGPDTLIVRHDPLWVADTAVPPNPLLGRENNCEGALVTSDNLPNATTGLPPVNTKLVEYRFSVVGGKLLCSADPAAAAGAGVVVADNIEDMRITYGIGSGKEQIVSYQTDPAAIDFSTVAAVRISLLVRGPSPGLVGSSGQQIAFNGAAAVTKTDGYLRQVYTSTFTVRNQQRFDK